MLDVELSDIEKGHSATTSHTEDTTTDIESEGSEAESRRTSTEQEDRRKKNGSSSDDSEGKGLERAAAELSWETLKVFSPKGKMLVHAERGSVKGRFVAIMGPSGAGKVRTLTRFFSGFLN